jgi:hypothetical protein
MVSMANQSSFLPGLNECLYAQSKVSQVLEVEG